MWSFLELSNDIADTLKSKYYIDGRLVKFFFRFNEYSFSLCKKIKYHNVLMNVLNWWYPLPKCQYIFWKVNIIKYLTKWSNDTWHKITNPAPPTFENGYNIYSFSSGAPSLRECWLLRSKKKKTLWKSQKKKYRDLTKILSMPSSRILHVSLVNSN